MRSFFPLSVSSKFLFPVLIPYLCLIIHLFITFLKIHVPFYYKIIVLALVGYNESKTVSVAESYNAAAIFPAHRTAVDYLTHVTYKLPAVTTAVDPSACTI